MTTLELIEKHGIGHNCLADAYELGRQDAIQEFRAECESASYIPIGYGYYVTDMKSIRKIAEQLKEQKKCQQK